MIYYSKQMTKKQGQQKNFALRRIFKTMANKHRVFDRNIRTKILDKFPPF